MSLAHKIWGYNEKAARNPRNLASRMAASRATPSGERSSGGEPRTTTDATVSGFRDVGVADHAPAPPRWRRARPRCRMKHERLRQREHERTAASVRRDVACCGDRSVHDASTSRAVIGPSASRPPYRAALTFPVPHAEHVFDRIIPNIRSACLGSSRTRVCMALPSGLHFQEANVLSTCQGAFDGLPARAHPTAAADTRLHPRGDPPARLPAVRSRDRRGRRPLVVVHRALASGRARGEGLHPARPQQAARARGPRLP